MRTLERLALTVATLALAASTSSCFAVTNLDRFQNPGTTNDLRLTIRGFTSHVNELFEYRIVDANNDLQARGQIVPLGDDHATMFATHAIPDQNGPFNLDFYADHDNNKLYGRDAAQGTGDHSWRIPLTPDLRDGTGAYVVSFDHNTSFTVLTSPAPPHEIGTPANIQLNNMGAFVGKRVEVRIAVASSKRTVAMFRVPKLAAATQLVTIPGMIDGGEAYTVEVYTDDNAPTPGSVKAFRIDAKSTDKGLDATFDPAAAPEVQDAPPP